MIELVIKIVMIILGFWLPSVLLNAIRAQDKAEAQSYGEKLCLGCGLFVILLMFLL